MGLIVDDKGGVTYREWAPNATAARLIGEFSMFKSLAWREPERLTLNTIADGWSHDANQMQRSKYGVWECYVPPREPGVCAIPHDSMVKISMTLPSGESIDRIPTWIHRVTQDLNISPIYEGRFWNPPKNQTYSFKNGRSSQPVDGLKIYEAHGTLSMTLFNSLTISQSEFRARRCESPPMSSLREMSFLASKHWVTTVFKCENCLRSKLSCSDVSPISGWLSWSTHTMLVRS